jgi:hypothetical protein
MESPANPSIRTTILTMALVAAALLGAALPSLPLWAQGEVGTAIESVSRLPTSRLQRAVSLARTTVESRHGSGAYSPAACLERSDGGNCLIEDDVEGFVFRIPGGPPGWQEAGQSPSRETVVRISRDGERLEKILYDGPPRP